MDARVNRLFRKAATLLVTLAVVGVAIFFGAHWVVSRSDAYASGVRTLSSSEQLRDRLGSVKEIRLDYLGHSSVEETEIDGRLSGTAQFTVAVAGDRRSEKVHVRLVRNQQGWTTVSAVLQDGTVLSIGKPKP